MTVSKRNVRMAVTLSHEEVKYLELIMMTSGLSRSEIVSACLKSGFHEWNLLANTSLGASYLSRARESLERTVGIGNPQMSSMELVKKAGSDWSVVIPGFHQINVDAKEDILENWKAAYDLQLVFRDRFDMGYIVSFKVSREIFGKHKCAELGQELRRTLTCETGF